jgi:hypothetical protein
MLSIPQSLYPPVKPAAIPVYHASIQGISGCVVQLDGVTYFSPMDDICLYALTDVSQLIVTSEVVEPIASFVRSEIEQKFLAHLQSDVVRVQGAA